MEIAKIKVSGNDAVVLERRTVTSGMVGATVAIEYDAAWDGLLKQVVFKTVYKTMNANGVAVPPEILQKAVGCELRVGVYGYTEDGTLVIPTVYASLGPIQRGADPDGDETAEATPPLWMQALGRIGDLDKLSTEAKESLVAAINELASQDGSVDDATIQKFVEEYLAEHPIEVDAIPVPAKAEVGQTIVVKAVGEDGKPTEWEAADLPGGGSALRLTHRVTLTEKAVAIQLDNLSLKLPLSIRVNAGTKNGNGMSISINGIKHAGYTGAGIGLHRIWLYGYGKVINGYHLASNNGVNYYTWDLPSDTVINSICLTSYYNTIADDGTGYYFDAGATVDIYEGVYPNVL